MVARLNISELETGSDAGELHAAGPNGDERRFEVSRRQALGVAGGLAVAASPAAKALTSSFQNTFSLSTSGGRAVFSIDGHERWVVDPRRFSGNPRLKVDRSNDLVRLRLSSAYFPGTSIPADFRAEIRDGVTGWRMSISFALARFQGSARFGAWLDGSEQLESSALVRRQSIDLGEGAALSIAGEGKLNFAPDWTIGIKGPRISRFDGLGHAVSDLVEIRLMDSCESSILRGSSGKRTLISASRGKNAWTLALPATPEGSHLETVDSGFDLLRLEARVNGRGSVERGLEAVARRTSPSLLFRPSSEIFGGDRLPFGLPIREARMLVVSGAEGFETALRGKYHDQPEWMHAYGASMLLGRDPRAVAGESNEHSEVGRPFLVHNLGRKVRLVCEPAILSVAAGLEGAVVEPQPLTQPTRLEIVYGSGSTRAEEAARLTIRRPPGRSTARESALSGAVHQLVIPNYVLSILRAEDLLSLRLEYYGFNLLVSSGNPPVLERNNQADPHILAYFAPQNIAEQAFFEQAPAGGVSQPGDPGQENPTPPGTVDRTIAGKSRLAFNTGPVFRIPFSLVPVSLPPLPTANRRLSRKDVITNTTTSVLDWQYFQQRVVPVALPPGETTSAAISKPASDRTSIEAPYRMMLSPSTYAFWNHTPSLKPGLGGEVELWHTRLGVTLGVGENFDDNDAGTAPLRTARGVWSPDYTTGTPPKDYEAPPNPYDPYNPYRASLDAKDRYQLVRLTSDYNSFQGGTSTPYVPVPVNVNRLALSSLGAWLDIKGEWDNLPGPNVLPPGLDIAVWLHRATMARDHYVKVVYEGYLFPFGHKAALIKVTERKFLRTLRATGAPGPIVAYLRQHDYILVRQASKTFNQADFLSYSDWTPGYGGREMAFKTVQLTTVVTPDIEDPSKPDSKIAGLSGLSGQDAFWPRVLINGAETDFLWHLIGTDWDGNKVEFTAPLIFLSNNACLPPISKASNLNKVNGAYNTSGKNVVSMKGQKIAFAPSAQVNNPNGTDPAVTTNSVKFLARIPADSLHAKLTALDPSQPQFFPAFANSSVVVPAIQHLLGKNANTNVAAAKPFLENGFDGNLNKGEVFLNLVKSTYEDLSGESQQLAMIFGAGDNGQVVTPGTLSPNLSIAGLSRSIGPVGAAIQSGQSVFDKVAGGDFDPNDFFGDPSSLIGSAIPKLFGAVDLTSLLAPLNDFTKYLNKVPGLKITRTDKAIMVSYFWETEQINPWPTTSGSHPEQAILAPWVIDEDGTERLPMNGSNPRYLSGGNITAPPVSAAPPPPPDLALDNSGTGVDGGGTDPTHVWAATYIIGGVETVAGLSNVISVPDGGSNVKVTVQPNKAADGGINIYRSKIGTAWPMYLLGTSPTIDKSKAQGSKPVDYTDSIADSSLSGDPPATWMQFGIDLQFTIPLDGTDPTYMILGEVAYASLQMDVIAVPFISLTFKVETGAKLTVNPRVNQIVFTGPLQFVNKLRDFMNNFSDPPFLDVSATGIDAGYTLSIPTIAVGAFSLQNISLGAKITVPFFGDSVVVGFLFCSKENPFILTVYIFGGGGWFEIDIAPDGLVAVHAGLEFGVDCALDIGVASGSVHVMAGVYFDYDKPSMTTSLTGFVDMGGSLDILGIISMSCDFHMQLTYTNQAGSSSVTGEASLTVDVGIFMIHISVTLGPIQKTFAGDAPSNNRSNRHFIAEHGSNNALPVGTMIKPLSWAAYSAAFAG